MRGGNKCGGISEVHQRADTKERAYRFYDRHVPSAASSRWRKRWDSNPRDLAVYLISSR